MIEKTNQKQIKGKVAEEQNRDNSRALAATPDLAPVKNPCDSTSLPGGEGGADELSVRRGIHVTVESELTRRDDSMEGGSGRLGEASLFIKIEKAINCNAGFHGFNDKNTKISVCRVCNQRLLDFAMTVHCHEVHTAHMLKEVE